MKQILKANILIFNTAITISNKYYPRVVLSTAIYRGHFASQMHCDLSMWGFMAADSLTLHPLRAEIYLSSL